MTQKPTFVLVAGAWHGPETWDKVTALLEAQQYKCISITLPSTLGNPSSTFLEDIQAVRDPIVAETSQGRDVIVVVHSYGGVVGESAVKGLTSASDNRSGRVIGIAMTATGFAATGKGFFDVTGGQPPPTWHIDEAGFAALHVDPRELFYHDLPVEEGNLWVSRLRKQAVKPLRDDGEYGYAGWQDVPSWFLATKEDKALPIEAQRLFVQLAREAGGDVTLREIESSHSPMLSRAQETADFLLEAATAFASP